MVLEGLVVRGAGGPGPRQQRDGGRGLDQGRVQDDGQRHGRDSHLQGRRQRLQDERRLTQGRPLARRRCDWRRVGGGRDRRRAIRPCGNTVTFLTSQTVTERHGSL